MKMVYKRVEDEIIQGVLDNIAKAKCLDGEFILIKSREKTKIPALSEYTLEVHYKKGSATQKLASVKMSGGTLSIEDVYKALSIELLSLMVLVNDKIWNSISIKLK